MNADAAPFGTGRTLGLQGTLRADIFGKGDHSTGHERRLLSRRTPDDLLLPVQSKRLLGKTFGFANRLGFAIHFQIVTALTHQMATQICPIDVQFLQKDHLSIQIDADRFRHTGFRHIRWR